MVTTAMTTARDWVVVQMGMTSFLVVNPLAYFPACYRRRIGTTSKKRKNLSVVMM
jgi:hypothetical protein